ncbi:MAG: hypothetical protein M3O46_23145 [Myxococcota bacterium]|nr:hypothetical protein [Myxococcota bacterium]
MENRQLYKEKYEAQMRKSSVDPGLGWSDVKSAAEGGHAMTRHKTG